MKKNNNSVNDELLSPIYGNRWDVNTMAKETLPESMMRADQAYQIIRDEINLQGNPQLNLATFVSTWMEPEAEELMAIGSKYNLIDEDEYPQLKVIEDRVIKMQANLFNAPTDCNPTGVTTTGSSEAIMLGLLAHKWRWRNERLEKGLDVSRPNVIFGADVHTCWEKFARYFDVEMRVIPMQEDKFTIDSNDVQALIDENTIAVGAIVGTTFTGQIDDIAGINQMLIAHKQTTGQDIPIHVDAASGGFVMPFINPDFEWDFRLKQVRSINVSNHKFGLVYAGLGTVIFKDKQDLPKELPFQINYLGGSMDNYSLTFSKTSSTLLAQYYNFLRFGKEGYKRIMNAVMSNANMLEQYLLESGYFDLLTDAKYLPVVVVKLKPGFHFSVYDISSELKKNGWIVPAYSLPANADKTSVLRMVIKENFSHDLAEKLVQDIQLIITELDKKEPKPQSTPTEDSGSKPHGVC